MKIRDKIARLENARPSHFPSSYVSTILYSKTRTTHSLLVPKMYAQNHK